MLTNQIYPGSKDEHQEQCQSAWSEDISEDIRGITAKFKDFKHFKAAIQET